MDTNTIALILTFLSTQTAALLAFWRWKEELKNNQKVASAISQEQRAELKRLVVALLKELGYSRLAGDQLDSVPTRPTEDGALIKELQ